MGGFRPQAVEHAGAEIDRLARHQRDHGAPRDIGRQVAHAERERPGGDGTVRPVDDEGEFRIPHDPPLDRHAHRLVFLLRQIDGQVGIGGRDGDFRRLGEGQRVAAGRAFHVVEFHQHAGIVAGIEEMRQGDGGNHRIAHDHVGARMADAGRAPRHRHHLHRAVEVGNVEIDGRLAVGADLDDAGKQRQRLLRRRRAFRAKAHAVAAGTNRAARSRHPVDELAVEIAHLHAELALAEIPVVGRRRLVAGEIENADVDGGDRHVGLVPGHQVGEPDRHRERSVRPHGLGRRQLNGEIALAGIDVEPGEPDLARDGMRLAAMSIGR